MQELSVAVMLKKKPVLFFIAPLTVYLCISVFLYWCASALVAELPHLSLHRTALSAGDDSTNTALHFDLWSIKPL